MLQIIFSDKAESDLNEIGEWYKNIRIGLELEFLVCIEAELELIRKTPLIYKHYYKGIRKAIISRFPFGIYYLVENKSILILAVAHHKRGQQTVRKKLKK